MASWEDLLRTLGNGTVPGRVAAAEALRQVSGDEVTRALVAALDADDTAVTQEALNSLLVRNASGAADLIWDALPGLDQELSEHVWFFLEQFPRHPVVEELERRYRARP